MSLSTSNQDERKSRSSAIEDNVRRSQEKGEVVERLDGVDDARKTGHDESFGFRPKDEKLDVSGPSSSAASATIGPSLSKGRNFILTPSLPSIKPFSGIIQDIRARAPFYLSDWTDAWNYRVVPATLLIFFAKYVIKLQYHINGVNLGLLACCPE